MGMQVFGAEGEPEFELPDDLSSLIDDMEKKAYHFSGYLKNETAYRFDEPRSFTKIRNILSLNFDLNMTSWARFYTSGWAYYDHVYEFFNYNTIVAREERSENDPLIFVENLREEQDNRVVDVKEFYLDLYLGQIDVRLGRQYVVWGVIEGIRIVDEINPLDFRELILPDLLDYRIPLWTAKLNYYIGNSNLEMLWIPELRFHKPAPAGSEWELFQILDRTTQPRGFDHTDIKLFDPRLSEYGIRFITDLFNAEVSLSYFYTWDDYPTAFRIISNSGIQQLAFNEEPAILPTYTRMHMFGSTWVQEIGGDIVRAELAYVTGKYFAVADRDIDGDGYLDFDGEVKRNHWRWALGYDFNWGGVDFAPSITQWYIPDYDPSFVVDQYDSTFNLFLRKPLRKISANFSMLFIYFYNFNEFYAKPKFTFNITDRFQVEAGLDVFAGASTQFGRKRDVDDPSGGKDIEQRARFVGNFKDNRRIFVNFKYNF